MDDDYIFDEWVKFAKKDPETKAVFRSGTDAYKMRDRDAYDKANDQLEQLYLQWRNRYLLEHQGLTNN